MFPSLLTACCLLTHLATTREECSTAVAKLLLENGASPNQADSSGDTALHQAIESFNGSLVQLMLVMGADFKIKERDGLSCRSLASGYGLPLLLTMLLAVGKSSASSTDWDFNDLVTAYWQAIKQQLMKTFQALVEKERRLLDESSSEGSTSLEICLSNEIQYGDGELIAIRLLELGADPFKRSLANHKSGFELGIITRRKIKETFVDSCLERVSKDLSSNTLDLGFQELRMITESDKPLWDKPELWDKLKPLRDPASTEIDHDGWSLDHFVHQSANRLPTQLTGELVLKPTRTPTGLVVPPMWSPPDTQTEALVEIAPSKRQASFVCR